MNRRQFLASIIAAAVAGPKAIASLLEQHRQRDALVFSIDYPYQFVTVHRTNLQKAWRKVQHDLREGFQYRIEEWDPYVRVADARSGFRAWSQRYPS